ncbi:MAG TPA: acetate/propionate family kinase [Candidatus Saccharimonadales bacterium]|nr:acetate/propionate family kinase [Candidatus Saccharimonadales bacterium]
MGKLILVSNPGSASRKYALYDGSECLAKIHFEHVERDIIYTYNGKDKTVQERSDLSHLAFAASQALPIFQKEGVLKSEDKLSAIALRVVAPSSYFQKHRILDDKSLKKLAELEKRAPLHVNAALQESHLLRQNFPDIKLIGVSDSAFHASKPKYAQYYDIPLDDAVKLDIKRFGYHGLSVESVVETLKAAHRLPLRLVVCHLGSGASVTAVKNGKSLDTTMGYSPLEGLMMATRAGSLDVTAAEVLQERLKLSNQQLEEYLNNRSGLLGVSGVSSDIRILLSEARQGSDRAGLALKMYLHRVRQAIGQMTATLGGIDGLVFTGTVGERSNEIRRRVVERLLFLGLSVDSEINHTTIEPQEVTLISPSSHPGRIYVVPSDEGKIMVKHAAKLVL